MKKIIYTAIFALSILATVTSCREEKSTGEKIEDGVEDVGESIEEGVEEIEDEIDDATDDD